MEEVGFGGVRKRSVYTLNIYRKMLYVK